ncbi:hypothetical protein Ccrd_025687 [Cynara cardunculus var. scolymus]|uniref:Protein kinase domain-containing protein n=1 Tax=Cynara cardunculus var. scolymus TaxID=59895 RepID=A0A124S091_CYNCS|nr:hypothetical protein Ccrd_025687 [Cynara cardunculus var. scolymus]
MMHVTKHFHHIKIQLEAITSATNNFSEDNCIGKGGFGEVYKGELIHSERQTVVAVKRLNRAFGQGDPEFWKEIIMLSRYKHENIVSLLGFCDESGEKILVYEYASKKSLDLYLNSEDLTWIQRLKICIGAARGLAYLHNPGGTQQRVLHRDIKSSNILLDENWNARISDLGLSKFGPANQQITFLVSNAVGTIGYCDPVYVETGVLTKESDVYSFGVMLFEVLCGRLYNCIGKGGFGKVYKGELIHSKGQTMVAIKRLNSAVGQGDPEFWTEIIVLSRYKHENIVSLLGFCDESGEKILVYEYASKKSLDLYLNSDDLTWIQRLKICIGAARGLAYLHNPDGSQQRVLHRDIKSSNILLDENWNARISDLGLSTFGPANQQITFLVTDAVGTFGYGDPVYFKEGVLTKESDVYSFGVMLFEVLCGRLCIRNNNDKHQPLARQCYEQNKVKEIIFRNIKDEIKARSLKAFTAIAYQCLKEDLEERPLMTKVVRILERALEHQQGDANSPTDYDSDDEDIVESDVSTLDGGTSRNYVKEKRLTMNMRLKKLRERVKKQQEEVEEKASTFTDSFFHYN